MIDKPYSPSCERNREPILAVLREHFGTCHDVLEIGSGSGQHAVHFAAAMPWLTWQCSDRPEYLPGIRLWLDEAGLANTPVPLELDVAGAWPLLLPGMALAGRAAGAEPRLGSHLLSAVPSSAGSGHLPPPTGNGPPGFDAAFSANTLHIMGWPEVEAFFAGLNRALAARATLVVYGPFNDGGRYSSDSNRAFDGWLQARDPRSRIRDVEAVDALARAIGLQAVADVAMPSHNRCLVWQRG